MILIFLLKNLEQKKCSSKTKSKKIYNHQKEKINTRKVICLNMFYHLIMIMLI